MRDCITMCFDICTMNIRVSIRVRGLHLVFLMGMIPRTLSIIPVTWPTWGHYTSSRFIYIYINVYSGKSESIPWQILISGDKHMLCKGIILFPMLKLHEMATLWYRPHFWTNKNIMLLHHLCLPSRIIHENYSKIKYNHNPTNIPNVFTIYPWFTMFTMD